MIVDMRMLVDEISTIGVNRSEANVPRRLLKVIEELGELAEAVLNVTCSVNYKKKTPADIREEAIDCMIVLLDCAMTEIYGTKHSTRALLPHTIAAGYEASIPIEWMEREIISSASAVSRAMLAYDSKNDMAYYGALAAAIRSVSKICFSPMDIDRVSVTPLVLSICERKLAKWQVMLDQIAKVNYEAA